MKNILFAFIFFSFLVSCKSTKKAIQQKNLDQLSLVQGMMSGTFSSEAQSIRDTNYFSINLVMHPIWASELDSKWLYVEQAVSSNLKKPYRQRVYQLSMLEDGTISSKVYELPDPENYVHAWEKENLFQQITPASLIERPGCAVYLNQDE